MENNYKLMNESDKISDNWHKLPFAVYVAFGEHNEIVAVGGYYNVYTKAIIRGCNTPVVENAAKCLSQRLVNSHNNLLQKAIMDREENRKN